MTIATPSMSMLVRPSTPQPVECSPASSPTPDAEACRIALLVGRGDETAFGQLYDLYHVRLQRLSLALSRGDESLAQETVQATFVTAARKLRGAESEQHLWNWLARVARQHIAKAWRQRGKDSPLVGLDSLPEIVDNQAPDSHLEESLDAALLRLETDERQLVEAFYFERLSHKEIAEQLNVTPKAISSRLERAREKLRSMIAQILRRES